MRRASCYYKCCQPTPLSTSRCSRKVMEEDYGQSDATQTASDKVVAVDAGKLSDDTQHAEEDCEANDEHGNGTG